MSCTIHSLYRYKPNLHWQRLLRISMSFTEKKAKLHRRDLYDSFLTKLLFLQSSYWNYRPISLLSNFSKIQEKLFETNLSKFLGINKIIRPNQYGFQPGVPKQGADIFPQ